MIEILKLIPGSDREIDPFVVLSIVNDVSRDIKSVDVEIPENFDLSSENSLYRYVGDTSMFYTPMNFEVSDSFLGVSSKEGFTASVFGYNSVIYSENLILNICDLKDSLLVVGEDCVVNFLGECEQSYVVVGDFKERVVLNPLSSSVFSNTRFYIGGNKSIMSLNRTMFT